MSDNRKSAKAQTPGMNAQMRPNEPLLNPILGSTDALLGIILNELRELRVEVKRIEENQAKFHEDITEKYEQLHEELRVCKKMQDDEIITKKQTAARITGKLMTIMLKLDKMQEDNESKTDEGEKKSDHSDELAPLDIRQEICGKWRNTDDPSDYYSINIEGDKLFIKWPGFPVHEFTLGVKHQDGNTFTVEDQKIVQKLTDETNQENQRYEYYIEETQLVEEEFYEGQLEARKVFDHAGDPVFD